MRAPRPDHLERATPGVALAFLTIIFGLMLMMLYLVAEAAGYV